MTSLAVCMIVKNEEEFLPGCIKSLGDVADSIIIGDTGSTDKTKEVAEELGARVVDINWSDDFAAARNKVIETAASDWILVIDADERMDETDRTAIRHIMEMDDIDAVTFVQRTYVKDSKIAGAKPRPAHRFGAEDRHYIHFIQEYDFVVECNIVRLFKNKKEFKFVGEVHEAVDPSIREHKGIIKTTDLVLHHLQYEKGADNVEDKQRNYLDIYQKSIHKYYNKARGLEDMGSIELSYMNRPEFAQKYFQQSIKQDPSRQSAYVGMFLSLMKQNKLEDALHTLQEGKKLAKQTQLLDNLMKPLQSKLKDKKPTVVKSSPSPAKKEAAGQEDKSNENKSPTTSDTTSSTPKIEIEVDGEEDNKDNTNTAAKESQPDSNNNPKILVGCPTSDHKSYCLEKYIKGLQSLEYPNMDILIIDNSKDEDYSKKIEALGVEVIRSEWDDSARERIIKARNLQKQKCIDGGYDYLFSVEQDVIVKSDYIERLLAHQKKIVTGIYYNDVIIKGKPVSQPVAYVNHPKVEGKLTYMPKKQIDKGELESIQASGLGCILIHKDVLEKITFRYAKGFDDMMFSKDAIAAGFEIFADTTILPEHLHSSWDGIEK